MGWTKVFLTRCW